MLCIKPMFWDTLPVIFHNIIHIINVMWFTLLTLWHPQLPYWYSKASCARLG